MTDEYLKFNDQNQLRKVSLDNYGNMNNDIMLNENRRGSIRENDRVLDEIAQRQQNLRKTTTSNRRDESDNLCLHDRLMSEIKQQRILKPIGKKSYCCFFNFSSLLLSFSKSIIKLHNKFRLVKKTNTSYSSSIELN